VTYERASTPRAVALRTKNPSSEGSNLATELSMEVFSLNTGLFQVI
jgi:hypothetical protein